MHWLELILWGLYGIAIIQTIAECLNGENNDYDKQKTNEANLDDLKQEVDNPLEEISNHREVVSKYILDDSPYEGFEFQRFVKYSEKTKNQLETLIEVYFKGNKNINNAVILNGSRGSGKSSFLNAFKEETKTDCWMSTFKCNEFQDYQSIGEELLYHILVEVEKLNESEFKTKVRRLLNRREKEVISSREKRYYKSIRKALVIKKRWEWVHFIIELIANFLLKKIGVDFAINFRDFLKSPIIKEVPHSKLIQIISEIIEEGLNKTKRVLIIDDLDRLDDVTTTLLLENLYRIKTNVTNIMFVISIDLEDLVERKKRSEEYSYLEKITTTILNISNPLIEGYCESVVVPLLKSKQKQLIEWNASRKEELLLNKELFTKSNFRSLIGLINRSTLLLYQDFLDQDEDKNIARIIFGAKLLRLKELIGKDKLKKLFNDEFVGTDEYYPRSQQLVTRMPEVFEGEMLLKKAMRAILEDLPSFYEKIYVDMTTEEIKKLFKDLKESMEPITNLLENTSTSFNESMEPIAKSLVNTSTAINNYMEHIIKLQDVTSFNESMAHFSKMMKEMKNLFDTLNYKILIDDR